MKNICRGLFIIMLIGVCPIFSLSLSGQSSQNEKDTKPYNPIMIKLNEEGDQYVRFVLWHQMWLTSSNMSDGSKLQWTPSIRRSRILGYGQLSSRFLILTHFGLNNFSPANQTSLGNNGDGAQFFLHGAWCELMVTDFLYVGMGIHYWNGLTRLSSASTLNFMTLDQARPWAHWHTLGVTDQFGRHLGVYAKGQIGKFDYRLAINSPGRNPLDEGRHYGSTISPLAYIGASQPDSDGDQRGNYIYQGYMRFNFWDQESTKLPFQVGSYLGKKKVLGVGTGFFIHPGGMYNIVTGDHSGVVHYALDAYLEYPFASGDMFHFYSSFIRFNYGGDYVSRWAGTGTHGYFQTGYYLKKLNVMPYLAVQQGNYDGYPDPVRSYDVGVNYYIYGHNCKLTLEYHHVSGDPREAGISTQDDVLSQLRLQFHIFI